MVPVVHVYNHHHYRIVCGRCSMPPCNFRIPGSGWRDARGLLDDEDRYVEVVQAISSSFGPVSHLHDGRPSDGGHC